MGRMVHLNFIQKVYAAQCTPNLQLSTSHLNPGYSLSKATDVRVFFDTCCGTWIAPEDTLVLRPGQHQGKHQGIFCPVLLPVFQASVTVLSRQLPDFRYVSFYIIAVGG